MVLTVITRDAQLPVPVFPIAIGRAVGVDGALVVVATGKISDLTQTGKEILVAGGALDFAVFQYRTAAFFVAPHGRNRRGRITNASGGSAAGRAAADSVVIHLRTIVTIDAQAADGQGAGGDHWCGAGYTVGAAVHGTVAAHQTEAALVAIFTVGDGDSVVDQGAAAAEPDKGHREIVVETTGTAVTGHHTGIAFSARSHAHTRIGCTQPTCNRPTANDVTGAAGRTR